MITTIIVTIIIITITIIILVILRPYWGAEATGDDGCCGCCREAALPGARGAEPFGLGL